MGNKYLIEMGVVVAMSLISLALGGFFIWAYRRLSPPRSFKSFVGAYKQLLIIPVCTIILQALAIHGLVFGHGPGRAPDVTPPEQEGRHRMNLDAPQEPSDEALEADAKTKKPEHLRQQDEPPTAAQDEANEYLQEALKRSKMSDTEQVEREEK